MKLIHHLSAGPFPRQEPETAVPEFFRWAGLDPIPEMDRQLDLLRDIQAGEDWRQGMESPDGWAAEAGPPRRRPVTG
jgi:hypothetical protein